MVDNGIRFAAHFPCIAIIPSWEDEGKVVGELIGPVTSNTSHDRVIEKLVADWRQVKA